MLSSPSWITLGTALKRATERLYGAIDDVYRRDGVLFQAAWFSVFRALADHGAQPVSTVATRIGQSHAAVSQASKKLAAAGYVASATASDRRQRLVALSARGRALAARLRDVWTEISDGFGAQFGGAHGDLLACVTNLETILATDALTESILAKAQARRARAITLLDFVPEHAAEFQRLNEEWLSASFTIEPVDAALLGDPQAKVIVPGGAIISASLHGELIGTCALLNMGGGVYELSKMAVTEVCRGLGVGKRLLQAAVDRFDALDGQRLFLESSKKLSPALKLYESFGFVHTPRPGGASPYARADVYMVLQRS
ncbi:MAG: bifunctional helix-turn-helix transcriptional regulator/GNAT family N-acetyltransferase [Nannocystaceae bacterium]|nr:bifunctional helix-turn-helix transcriptional regulator/GNAT family N-acetyltransferase [Nannocystaceae bacterium]